jgi:hypothetical protein
MSPKRKQAPRAQAFDPQIQAALDRAEAEAQAKRAAADRQARNAAARERYAAKRSGPETASGEPERKRPIPGAPIAGRIIRVDIRDWAAWKAAHGLQTDHYDPRADLWFVTDRP